jgi:hypothetical protein
MNDANKVLLFRSLLSDRRLYILDWNILKGDFTVWHASRENVFFNFARCFVLFCFVLFPRSERTQGNQMVCNAYKLAYFQKHYRAYM